MVGVGVIGYGYWGPNLVRNFFETPDATVVAVSDLRPERLASAHGRFPSVRTTQDHRDLLTDPRIDAVAIATPVSTHHALAMQALRAGKHVLVEKPLAASSEHAQQMIELASRLNRVLLVDHTFLHTGAVRKIRELIEANEVGDIYYFDSVRVNLGLFQHDINVIWDLAVHDLAIMDYLIDERPCGVSATGISHVARKPENIAYLTLFFPGSLIAHIHVNWLAPVKVRRTLIGGKRRMIVYDDLEPSEKVKVYDKGLAVTTQEDVYETMFTYRSGDMWAPRLDTTEALRREAELFIRCIDKNELPIAECERGLRVIRMLEAASRSMARQGWFIELGDQMAQAA